jgi:hypothetical protein
VRAPIQLCRRLAAVDAFTLFVVLRSAQPVDDAAVTVVSRALRPGDEELRIWRDEQDPGVVRVSTGCGAPDLEGALDAGHALARETRALWPFPTSVDEVVAMTDAEQLVWRAEP